MSAANLQALLRFLSQDAKVPLATAMSRVKELQQAQLDTMDALAKAKPQQLTPIFSDEKLAKGIITAAKRVSKKRAAGEDIQPSPRKKTKGESLFSIKSEQSPDDLEVSLVLPYTDASPEDLANVTIFTNRAPLVLAFSVMLLKYTMPEQPLSSRLSLSQAYVGTTSRSRAVSLGLETGKSAEEEGFGEGQPHVTIMGQELRVLRRWGYDYRGSQKDEESTQGTIKAEDDDHEPTSAVKDETYDQPALWALDLEALRKSGSDGSSRTHTQAASTASMPIYTPQSARAYLLKSFDDVPSPLDDNKPKRQSHTQKQQVKERNLGLLLRAIDLLYQSWISVISPDELDKRIWGWYIKVRPAVEHGVAGWGGKNVVRLSDILDLRREA